MYRFLDFAQDFPDIDGDRIVWDDSRNGNDDIYLGSIAAFRESLGGYTGERITDDPAAQERPSVSGDYIVWQDNRNGNWDIYLYDYSTREETQLTNDTGKQWLPIVRGNYAAWYDDSSGATNIVVYDIAAGEVKAVIESDARTTIPFAAVATEFKPALSERYVAWVEASDDERIHYYEIETGATGRVSPIAATQSWPSLSGSLIAWEDYRHGSGDPEIYMTDLDGAFGAEQRITEVPGYQVAPAISGNIIVWEDMRDGPRSIYLYDIAAGREMSVFVPGDINDEQLYPAVSGNTIAWQRGTSPNSNLYIFVYDPAGVIEPVLETIEITPEASTLEVGATQTFQAVARDQSGNEMDDVTVNWTSSDETVGTITADGVFTAVAEGTATVTATAGSVSADAIVTVTGDTPVATNITIEPPGTTLAVNGTEQFSATVRDQFGAVMDVTVNWTSSDETVGTIDADGVFNALAPGTTTVTATADNATAEVTVTVTEDEPVPASITIEPPGATLAVGETEQFTATVLDQGGNTVSGVTVNWTSSDETVGTIAEDGTFTALAAGTTNVTATAGNVSAEVTVTVTDDTPVATSLRITPPSATLAISDTQRFMVTALDQNEREMDNVTVEWTSSDETVGTITQDGIFTALAAGTATLTASAGNVSAEATVTVNEDEPALAKIEVQPSAVTLSAGNDLLFEAVAFDRSGNVVSADDVVWTSGDEAVGTITVDGVFSALAAGTTNVTATAGNVSAEATVTVTDDTPVETSIAVTPAAITLNVDETATFTATVLDQNGLPLPAGEVNWTSSDETVGTIGADGTFTALAEGTVTVTASSGSVTETATVTITDLSSGVVVSPSELTLSVDGTWQFSATAYDTEGNVTPGEVTWLSDDPNIGTIDASSGLFTAEAEGTTTITASVSGVNETGSATVTVLPAPAALTRIVISPSAFTIAANNTLTLTATDQDGDAVPDVVWTSSDEAVGTVDENGTFSALAEGTVTLTAEAEGASGSASATVLPSFPVPTGIEVDPPTVTVAPGETRVLNATVRDQRDNEMDWVRVDWACSDTSVGSIDRAGLFAAFAEGSAEVTASAGGVTMAVPVIVSTDPATEPTPTPANPGTGGGGGGGDSSGGSSAPTISAAIRENLRSGETFTFTGITVSSVSSVAVTAADAIPRMMVTVKEVARPNAAEPPAGDVYEYVDITLSWINPQSIRNATVAFTVPVDWLEERDMTPEDVRLMRYVNSTWQSLETTFLGEESGNYRFQAVTPGFSTFAITAASGSVVSIEEINATIREEINVTTPVDVTGNMTTEPTTVPTMTTAATTTPAAPLVFAPLLAPLAFLLWGRRKH